MGSTIINKFALEEIICGEAYPVGGGGERGGDVVPVSCILQYFYKLLFMSHLFVFFLSPSRRLLSAGDEKTIEWIIMF